MFVPIPTGNAPLRAISSTTRERERERERDFRVALKLSNFQKSAGVGLPFTQR